MGPVTGCAKTVKGRDTQSRHLVSIAAAAHKGPFHRKAHFFCGFLGQRKQLLIPGSKLQRRTADIPFHFQGDPLPAGLQPLDDAVDALSLFHGPGAHIDLHLRLGRHDVGPGTAVAHAHIDGGSLLQIGKAVEEQNDPGRLFQSADALFRLIARMGRPASMILKNNSISDRDIILKLQEASCAGVRIDMIVRGICCVRAGVPGKTENLHIRSLVGRYLEHGRIYSFFDGVHTRIYIASGDFLTRNTECRVEVGVRVEDPVLVKKLTDILQLQLRDNVNAREMRPDGSYQKVKPAEGEPIVNGQMGMYDLLRNDWTREEPWKSTTPKAAPAEAPAAEKQTAAEGPKAKTPEVPVQEPPKAKGPDFVEAAPATPAPIHLEPTEHPKGGDHFDELEQMLDKKHLPDQPQKPTVVVTAPKKRGLFSQVLGLFKKRK